MKSIKCDICGKYQDDFWREVMFSYWKGNDLIDVREICQDCINILEKKIKEMALNSK